MSNIFLVYDQYGNILQATTNYPQVNAPSQLLVCDENTPNASAALAQRQNYMIQNGQIVPAATIIETRSQAQNGSFVTWTLGISTSDQQAHDITLNVLGHTETLSVPAGGIQYQIDVHQSVNTYHFPVSLSGQGLITYETFVGGNSLQPPGLQTYKDTSGLLHIAPTQKVTLLSYYTQQVSPASVIADIGTSLGMVSHFSYTKVPAAFRLLNSLLTWAQQATYSAFVPSEQDTADIQSITLTPDENNALADINANVIPSILTTLAEAAPKPADGQPQSYDLHYASYSRHIKLSGQAFSDYVADIQSIPNLT